VHSHLFFTSLLSVFISKIKNKPCVITVHGVRAVRDKATNLLQEIWIKFFSSLIFRICKKVFCQTKADAEEIKKYGVNNNKIEIIPNGIDTTIFSLSDINNGYILWVGRFVKEKGLEFLVEAIYNIKEKFSIKKVVLVGYGPLKQYIIDLINKKKLNNIFIYKDKCSQKEIAKLMKNCELFVLPSLQEGFPKSLLEAMACGKPVITTNGLKEIVNGAGITVEAANVKQLSNAINKILSNPSKWKKAGLNGALFVNQNWSWDIVTKKIEGVYNFLTSCK
jgi:glycosyltransferase involved in cell wall biosynthesis